MGKKVFFVRELEAVIFIRTPTHERMVSMARRQLPEMIFEFVFTEYFLTSALEMASSTNMFVEVFLETKLLATGASVRRPADKTARWVRMPLPYVVAETNKFY